MRKGYGTSRNGYKACRIMTVTLYINGTDFKQPYLISAIEFPAQYLLIHRHKVTFRNRARATALRQNPIYRKPITISARKIQDAIECSPCNPSDFIGLLPMRIMQSVYFYKQHRLS